MTDPRTLAIIDDLRKLPAEAPWAEFKENNADAPSTKPGSRPQFSEPNNGGKAMERKYSTRNGVFGTYW